MTSTFVGRERELATLESALEQARRGIGGLALVSGEAGIGKTMLVQRFCAATPGLTVLWGSCWDEGGAPTYWPWVQVLRGAESNGGQDAIDGLAACLAPLGLESPLAFDQSSPVERFALFDAVTQILHAVADRGPLVVVLEDLHAGGCANALLVDFVARHSRHAGLLVVGTYRDADVRLDPDLASIVGQLEAAATMIALPVFSAPEVRELAEAMLPDLPGGLVAEVLDRTQGHPLFVTQVLSHLERADGQGIDSPVPAALRQAIRRRAERVAAAGDVPEFLDVAAVLGGEIDLPLLSAAIDAPLAAVCVAAESACEAGILRPTSEGYEFVHSLVREAVYGDLKPAQRAAWHLAVARELAGQDRHPALVAHHFMAAWPAGGAEEAAEHALRAGDEAMAALASEDAVGHYRRALAALGRTASDRTRERCETLLSIGAALLASGRLLEVRREVELAASLAEQLGDPGLMSRAALLGSEHLEFNAVDHTAIALLQRADAAWGEATSPLRARVLARLAVAVASSDPAAAARAAAAAEVVATQVDDPETLAAALSARLHADWGRHDPAAALQSAQRIQSLVPDSVDGHVWCAVFALERGELDLATSAVAEVERLGADERRPTVGHLALSRRSTLAAVRGKLDEALDLATRAWELGRRCGLPDADAVYWGQLFVIWRVRGLDPVLAARMEQILLPLVEHSPLRMAHEAALVQILLARGETGDARRRYDSLVALVPSLPHDMLRVFSLALMAESCVAFADTASAQLLYDSLAEYADRFVVAAGAVACTGSAHRPLAGLATLLGRDTVASEHLEAAAAAHRAAGGSWDQPGPASSISLEREGSVWAIRQGAVVVRLADTRGLGYLAELIHNPGRDISALQLVAGSVAGSMSEDLHVSTGSDPVLDATAKAAYQRRLMELDEEIGQAESWHDPERLSLLQAERDVLVHEITAAFGLGGRPRRLGSESERARLNVTRAIRTAIRNVGAQAPDLGADLDSAVSTGTSCRYDPRPGD